jgi:hypothetical protein
MFSRLFGAIVTTWQEISSDTDFMELRKDVDYDFEKLFHNAYRAYIRGDWFTASHHL